MGGFVTLGIAASPAVRAGRNLRAEVAELADAHGSGPCTRKGVGVRVPSSAPKSLLSFYNHQVSWRQTRRLTQLAINSGSRSPNLIGGVSRRPTVVAGVPYLANAGPYLTTTAF